MSNQEGPPELDRPGDLPRQPTVVHDVEESKDLERDEDKPPRSFIRDRSAERPSSNHSFIGSSGSKRDLHLDSLVRSDHWYGLDGSPHQDFVLYLRREDDPATWILIYAGYSEQGDAEEELPPSRELSPRDASRWLRVNKHRLPEGVPFVTVEESESQGELDWIDPEWRHSTVASLDTPPSPPAESTASRGPFIFVDMEKKVVFMGVEVIRLEHEQDVALVDALVRANGKWISFNEYSTNYPCLKGKNPTRIRNRLRKNFYPIWRRIESDPKLGYRLK